MLVSSCSFSRYSFDKSVTLLIMRHDVALLEWLQGFCEGKNQLDAVLFANSLFIVLCWFVIVSRWTLVEP